MSICRPTPVRSRSYRAEKNADRAVDAAHQIAQRDTQLGRQAVRLAVHRQRAGHGLEDDVEAGPILQRAGLAVARDRAVDQARVDRLQFVVAQPQPRHHAGAVILDQNVALGGQILNQRQPVRALEVNDDRLLAAIDRKVIVALAVARRRKGAGLVPRARRFDLEHFGAHVRQREARGRSGQHTREIDHAHTRQGAFPFRVGHGASLPIILPGPERPQGRHNC